VRVGDDSVACYVVFSCLIPTVFASMPSDYQNRLPKDVLQGSHFFRRSFLRCLHLCWRLSITVRYFLAGGLEGPGTVVSRYLIPEDMATLFLHILATFWQNR
jgi:hypothetical protein